MQHLLVSGAVRPLKWPLGVKWLNKNLIIIKILIPVLQENFPFSFSRSTEYVWEVLWPWNVKELKTAKFKPSVLMVNYSSIICQLLLLEISHSVKQQYFTFFLVCKSLGSKWRKRKNRRCKINWKHFHFRPARVDNMRGRMVLKYKSFANLLQYIFLPP
jgi:hypothetical protein